jgi:hypothetical protein
MTTKRLASSKENGVEEIDPEKFRKGNLSGKSIPLSIEHLSYKYSNGTSLAESILVNGLPFFLQIRNDIPILSEKIEIDNMLLVPPHRNKYLSKEYCFSTKKEIESYIKRATRETLDSLFIKVKNVWSKYFDVDNLTLNLCAADTLLTYFQDKLGMTHYLLFVGDNSTGKSNALTIFEQLGYRPLKDVGISPANIYNFLGQLEEGQGIILEDEIDDIDGQEEKKKIYKSGYTSGTKVTRIYESNSTEKKNQKRYNCFCFKAFTSEKQPSFYHSKGFIERLIPIQCIAGNPDYDILEVINDAGDKMHKKLSRELNDLRKLLLVFRILNHDKPIPDIDISLKNREKQLCKPLVRLFQNSRVIHDVLNCLTKFISEKRNKKLDSLDSILYSIVSDLAKNSNGYKVSNEEIWTSLCTLPGNDIPNKPHCYQTDEFGLVSKNRISRICEDKFGAKRTHNGKQRTLLFDKNALSRFQDNYSPIKRIEIIQSHGPNTNNTFNAFWNNVENRIYKLRNGTRLQTINSNQEAMINERPCENNLKICDSKPINSHARQSMDHDNELKTLEMLDSAIQSSQQDSESNYLIYLNSGKQRLNALDKVIHKDFENNLDIGYKKPFYFCKKHPHIQNIHYEEIADHLRLSNLHKISK